MKIAENLWLESAYYIDIDDFGQLRIAGPNNHLYFGSVGIEAGEDFEITDVASSKSGELVIAGRFAKPKLVFHDPAIGPMLQIRSLIEPPSKAKPTFAQVMRRHAEAVLPHYVSAEQTAKGFEISYRRYYGKRWYGVKLALPKGTTVHRMSGRHAYSISGATNDPIKFTLTTEGHTLVKPALNQVVGKHKYPVSLLGQSGERIQELLDRLSYEIEFLVSNDRTSGFDFGTIFPRDWMESADLGIGDITAQAAKYMYSKSLMLVNSEGLGWHENIVGELEAEKSRQANDFSASLEDLIERESRLGHLMQDMVKRVQEMYVIRNMIDIEPHYLLGLQRTALKDFSAKDKQRLKQAAKYIISQAESNRIITFKKIPDVLRRHRGEEYYSAGNWRDSGEAFRMIHPVLAPFDVNAVFYPEALKLIRNHAKFFDEPIDKLDRLMEKWASVKDLYRYKNADGTTAFALALYDVKQEDKLEYRRLEVNHTDEAYDLFYGQPQEGDLASFCKRLLDEKYFYTPSGPTIVGAQDGYTTLQYHGRVIWTKQTAFVVAGLAKQLQTGKYSQATMDLMAEALLATSRASINAIVELDSATELHYSKGGRAHNYNDQKKAEGPMNRVQLWSAVGARNIIRNYLWALERVPASKP